MVILYNSIRLVTSNRNVLNKHMAKKSGSRVERKKRDIKHRPGQIFGKKDLVESMPRRPQDMIACGGLVSKYLFIYMEIYF